MNIIGIIGSKISDANSDKIIKNNLISSTLDLNLFSNNSMNKKDTDNQIPKNKNICWVKGCKKKLGLNGFECKCGTITCSAHRYPFEHSCPIDYKQIARDKIKKNNPVVIADKIVDRI